MSKIQLKIIPCSGISKLSNSNHHTSHPVTLCSVKTDYLHLLRNEYIYFKYFIKSPVNVLYFAYWRYCLFDFSGNKIFRERESLCRRKTQTDEYTKSRLQILLRLNLFSGQSRILFFLGCIMYLCVTDQWSRETDHVAFARTECVCFLCSPCKLISAGSWCWLSLQGEHTKLITLCNRKEIIFTEKIPSIL